MVTKQGASRNNWLNEIELFSQLNNFISISKINMFGNIFTFTLFKKYTPPPLSVAPFFNLTFNQCQQPAATISKWAKLSFLFFSWKYKLIMYHSNQTQHGQDKIYLIYLFYAIQNENQKRRRRYRRRLIKIENNKCQQFCKFIKLSKKWLWNSFMFKFKKRIKSTNSKKKKQKNTQRNGSDPSYFPQCNCVIIIRYQLCFHFYLSFQLGFLCSVVKMMRVELFFTISYFNKPCLA